MQKKQHYSLLDLGLYFFKLGTFGYGGAFTLMNTLHKDLVEKKHWITNDEFKQGLAFTQFVPGPLLTQMGMYIGFLRQNMLGAFVAGAAFFLTPALSILVLSIVYVHFGNSEWMRGAFRGISPAVVGMIIAASISLIGKTITKKFLWGILVVTFLISLLTGQTPYYFFIFGGLASMLWYLRVRKQTHAVAFLPIGLTVINLPLLWSIFLFFFGSGFLAFGGGLTVLPYMQTGVVSQYHWLTQKQFLDGISIAMITPGPVILLSTFVGYIKAGLLGAFIGTLGVFLPALTVVLLTAPLLRKHAENKYLRVFTDGVVAAAMGALCSTILSLTRSTVVDAGTLGLLLGAFVGSRFLKIPSTVLVLIAGSIGLFLLR